MNVLNLIPLFSLLYNTQINGYEDGFKELTISEGQIRGRQLTTYKNNSYYAFQDIPYALPPIGPLRLRNPVPVEKWEGILNTTSNSKICYQFEASKSERPGQNEDCLVVSVYAPVDGLDYGEKLAVLVWIHGGGFASWSGAIESFGPDYFIDQKIVVVTMNYRLGALGFLSTDDGVIPENIGLKDQHLALKWVQRNIDSFGGDPSKVTLAGQSAGAASVGYHVLSKKSEGLFRGAILQSGTPLSCWGLQKNSRNVAQIIAQALAPNSSKNYSSYEILDLLESANISQLLNASFALQSDLFELTGVFNCHLYTSTLAAPVMEDEDDHSAIVVGLPHENIKNGILTQVPILIGINSEESLLFGVASLTYQATLFDASLDAAITANLNMKDENKKAAGEELKNLYTDRPFSTSPGGSLGFFSDCMFTTPVARHAFLQSNYTDVYFYQFSYRGTLGRLVYNDIEGAAGVAHQEEIGYIWHNSTDGDLSQYPAEDILVHNRVVELWSQFIKYSNPTAKKSEVLGNITWPKVTQDQFSYLNIDSELTVKYNPRKYVKYSAIYNKYAEDQLDTY